MPVQYEIEFPFNLTVNAPLHWQVLAGTWFSGQGVRSDYTSNQFFTVRLYPQPGTTILRIGAEVLCADGAAGTLTLGRNVIETSSYTETIAQSIVNGPETHYFDQPFGWSFSDSAHWIQLGYYHAGADSEEIVTLRKMVLLVEGYPDTKKLAPILSNTVVWPKDANFGQLDHLE